jgi:hypothetical protein
MACKAKKEVLLRNGLLPLKDLFCNQKLEFDIELNRIKVLFSELKLPNVNFGYISKNKPMVATTPFS